MRRYFLSHWFWFFVFLISYSVYDYFNHISRPGTLFETYPTDWFLFSFVSTLTVAFSIYFIANGLLVIRVPSIVAEIIAFTLSFLIHLGLTGPIWDYYFWPHEELHFPLDTSAIGVLVAFYVAYRILFAIIIALVNKFLITE